MSRTCSRAGSCSEPYAAIALIVTLRFPPFILVLDTMTINLGFGFLFDPPTWRNSVPGTVNVPLLLTEWVAIAILAGRHTGARQAVARAATPTRLTGAI